MANDLAIKRRIKSVKSIRQVTKTMQIVSASRVKKVQESAQKLQEYSKVLMNIISKVSGDADVLAKNKYFQTIESGKDLVIYISTARGLAGALPSALNYKVLNWLKQNKNDCDFISINKRGFKTLKKMNHNVISYFEEMNHKTELSNLDPVVSEVRNGFLKGKYESVYIVYAKFHSLLIQKPVVEKLLPISKDILMGSAVDNETQINDDVVIEPSVEDVLNDIIPHYLEMRLFDAIINSSASEEAARMIAMKNATDNAKDMIDDLVLSFNKSRQMKITQQVAEISAAL